MSAELFDGLDDAARAELRTQLRGRDLAAGDVLCRVGDSSDCLYVVESGLLQVLDGESGEVLGRQRVGDVVGEVALLTGDPRSATLVAQVPSVVSELSRDDFLAAATHHRQLLVNLATIVSLIGATHSRSGLRVRSELDRGHYPSGVAVSDAQMATVRLERHRFHGDWNYTIHPTTTR